MLPFLLLVTEKPLPGSLFVVVSWPGEGMGGGGNCRSQLSLIVKVEEHVFGTTVAMRQKEQAHFWLSSTNYENLSLL